MANPSLSQYVVKAEDFDDSIIDTANTTITFFKQFNFVICKYRIVAINLSDNNDHTIIIQGKIPSDFRPTNVVYQDVTNYLGVPKHGLISIFADGSLKFRIGSSADAMSCHGNLVYSIPPHDPLTDIYSFTITAPKYVQIGDSYTVSAIANNSQYAPLPLKDVVFTANNTAVGTHQTDSNGIAEATVTADGSGLLTYVAESEESRAECQVFDCLCYDGGITGDKSSDWNIGTAIATPVTDDEGTELSVTSANTLTGLQISTKPLTDDFEAIVYSESNDTATAERTRFGIYDGTNRRFIQKGGNYFLKVVRESGVTTGYYSEDGTTWTQSTLSGTEPSNSPVYIFIGLYNTSSTTQKLKYRELRVYSI